MPAQFILREGISMRTIHTLCLLFTLTFSLTVRAVTPPSNAAIEQIIHEQEAAWNSGDGDAWAAAFSDEADFINIRGDLFQSRPVIAKRHVSLLSGPFKGSHVTIIIRSITKPDRNIAVIETGMEVTNFKTLPPGVVPTSEGVLKTRMKYVAIYQGDKWHIIAAQNTAILPAVPSN